MAMESENSSMEKVSDTTPLLSKDISPDCEEQKKAIGDLLNPTQKCDDTRCLVVAKWINKWKRYVGFYHWDCRRAGKEPPGPMYTASLLAEDGKLQEGLIEDLDYCLVPESAWKKFSIWYKDSTVITRISRNVVGSRQCYRVDEVYLDSKNKVEGEKACDNIDQKGIDTQENRSCTERLKKALVSVMPAPKEPGVCGLENHGNTCFMNSALQCLSNTPNLTSYFCSNSHRRHINMSNPLGMGGQIAMSYGDLIQEIWSGPSKVARPLILKEAIELFEPLFVGTRQHDLQELLSSLLDGLHEDLNVAENPFVDMTIEAEDRADQDIAEESWHKYLQRNLSIIVKLFEGQLRSSLECPECHHVAKVFDPFRFLPLRIPLKRCLNVIFVRATSPELQRFPIKLRFGGEIQEIKEEVALITDLKQEDIEIMDYSDARFGFVKKRVPPTLQTIYAFERRKCQTTDSEMINVILCHAQQFDPMCKTFGQPMVLSVPSSLMYHQLYSIISEKVSFREHLVAPDVAETEEIMNNEDRKQDENEANEVPMDTDDNLDEQCNQQHMNKTNVNTEEENETTPITGNFELGDSASKDPEKEVSDFTTNEKEVSDSVNKEKGVSDSVPKEKEVSDSVPKEKEVNDSVPKEEEVFEEPMNLDGMDNGNEKQQHRDGEGERDVVHIFKVAVNGEILDKSGQLHLRENGVITCQWPTDNMQYYKGMAVKDECQSDSEVREKYSLLECFKFFTAEETCECFCSTCRKSTYCKKKLDFWKFPSILIIQLKRFTSGRQKLDVPVECQLQLDLEDFTKNDDQPKQVYNLYAWCEHIGGMHAGHYTAFCKNEDNGAWYRFNDAHVSKVADSEPDHPKNAYILFYARQDDHNPKKGSSPFPCDKMDPEQEDSLQESSERKETECEDKSQSYTEF